MSDRRLLAIARRKRWRDLEVGMAAEEVIDELGPPDDKSAIHSVIWRYGRMELAFHDGHIALITLHAGRNRRGHPWGSSITREVLESALGRASIEVHEHSGVSFETQTALVSQGVTWIFGPGAGGVLVEVAIDERGSDAPASAPTDHREIADEFLATVAEFGLDRNVLRAAWRSRGHGSRGFDEHGRLTVLHGAGIRVTDMDGRTVDADARSDADLGFDAWRLVAFAESIGVALSIEASERALVAAADAGRLSELKNGWYAVP